MMLRNVAATRDIYGVADIIVAAVYEVLNAIFLS